MFENMKIHMRKPGVSVSRLPCNVRTIVLLNAAIVFVIALFPESAHAYIDPGSGSFIIQGIIAAALGAGVAVKLFWRRIVAKITGAKAVDEDLDD